MIPITLTSEVRFKMFSFTLIFQVKMADPWKGRGRGLALIQALKKTQLMDSGSSGSPSPADTPDSSAAPSGAPSVAPSVVS